MCICWLIGRTLEMSKKSFHGLYVVSMSDIYISFSVNVVNPTITIITVLSHKNDKEYKKEYKNAEYFHH